MSFAKLSEDNRAFLMDAIKKLEIDKKIKEEGKIEGKIEDILELLNDLGEVPKDLRTVITSEEDIEVLKKWVKIAARSKSIDEFRTNIN